MQSDKAKNIRSVLRVLVGGFFVFSGWTKLLEGPESFFGTILNYRIVSPATASLVAKVFPWAEYLGGVFLMAGLWSRAAALVLWTLDVFFIGALASVVWRRLPLEDCGCFGASGLSFSPLQALGIDLLVLTGLTVLLLGTVSKSTWYQLKVPGSFGNGTQSGRIEPSNSRGES